MVGKEKTIRWKRRKRPRIDHRLNKVINTTFIVLITKMNVLRSIGLSTW